MVEAAGIEEPQAKIATNFYFNLINEFDAFEKVAESILSIESSQSRLLLARFLPGLRRILDADIR